MTQGAPDYVHLRQILARDALGNLVPVACDPSGRVILLPYGTQTVSQNDPTRTIQGADGEDLYTIAVDAAGRLIMLPYGWDGATYRPLKVDDEGRMIGVMKGQTDVKWGLRGWWKFLASEETTIKDYSGYGNNGSAFSGGAAEAKYEDGIIGQSLSLDGVNDYVNCGNDLSLRLEGQWSLEAWIYTVDLSHHNGIMNKNWADPSSFVLYVHTNRSFILGTKTAGGVVNTVISPLDLINTNQWYHIIVTYNNGDVNLYLNGTVVESDTIADIGAVSVSDFKIGVGIGGGEYWDGQLDEVRLYARALSADEVSWRYANTNPAVGKPTRMIAVDSEGRMLVNIQDLPYKDTVMISDYVNDHAAGTVKIEFDPVPSGKLWIITNCISRCMLDVSGATSLYIRRGDEYYMIAELMRAAQFDTLSFNGHAYLKAGDILACWFSAVDVNKSCSVYANGYSLDV